MTSGVPRRLAPGDAERFEGIVLPHLDAAYNLARHLMRDDDDARDAVQEAFLRAVRHFDGYRGGDARAWLMSIVRNTCFTQLRGRRAGAATTEFDEELHSAREGPSAPEADLTRRATAEAVQAALARLPLVFREALVLREMEGMSYKEIAEVTGAPIGTVMSRLARARAHLLDVLGGSEARDG